MCKYEGNWFKDEKHGFGRTFFPDGSKYEGNLNMGVKDGFGKFEWPNGESYDGRWRAGKMDGAGVFKKADGQRFAGTFKNNHFHKGGNIYINPFDSREEIEEKIDNQASKKKVLKEKIEREKNIKLLRLESLNDTVEQMLDSNSKNRVPLLLSSREKLYTNLEKFLEVLKTHEKISEKFIFNFDLRKCAAKKEDGTLDSYMQEVKQSLARCIVEGGLFIVNIDDSEIEYNELSEPEIYDFYCKDSLPKELFKKRDLQTPECYEKVLQGTEFEGGEFNVEGFNIAVWSKFKVSEGMNFDMIVDKVERRYLEILPLKLLDIFVLCNL